MSGLTIGRHGPRCAMTTSDPGSGAHTSVPPPQALESAARHAPGPSCPDRARRRAAPREMASPPVGSSNHVRPHPPRSSPPGFRSRLLSKTSWRTKGSWPLVPTPPPMGSPRAPARVGGPVVHSLHQRRECGSKMTRCGYLGTITWRDRTPDQRMSAYRDVSGSGGKQLVVSTRTRSRASQ